MSTIEIEMKKIYGLNRMENDFKFNSDVKHNFIYGINAIGKTSVSKGLELLTVNRQYKKLIDTDSDEYLIGFNFDDLSERMSNDIQYNQNNKDLSKRLFIFNKRYLNQHISLVNAENSNIQIGIRVAERYKNLDKTMLLGKKLGIKPVVITQQYFENQPIVTEYKELAKETNSILYVDEPFFLPQYIVKNYSKKIIMLIPSEREIFGLVINEMRRFNKDNVLIVANDRGGLTEQINDGEDGVLVDLNDINNSAKKISKYFNSIMMKKMNVEGQKRLSSDYDLIKNFDNFLRKVLKNQYE